MDEMQQVILMLGEIKGEVTGVNRRLDTINGRINKHDEQIAALNTQQATENGSRQGVGKVAVIVSTTVSVLIGIVGLLIKR